MHRDIEHSSVPIYSVQGHKEIIMSIDGVAGTSVGCGAPEIVTGSQDGKGNYVEKTKLIQHSLIHYSSLKAMSKFGIRDRKINLWQSWRQQML